MLCCAVLSRLPGLPQQLPPVVRLVVARPVAGDGRSNQVLLRGGVQRFGGCWSGQQACCMRQVSRPDGCHLSNRRHWAQAPSCNVHSQPAQLTGMPKLATSVRQRGARQG